MAGAAGSLVELRLLEGPNLYFPRAAVKLTLDVAELEALSAAQARRVAEAVGLTRVAPGEAGTIARTSFLLRLVRSAARRLAGAAGVSRLSTQARMVGADRVVLAFPWKNSGRAEAFGEGLAAVLDRLPGCDPVSLTALFDERGQQVRTAEPGRRPSALRPNVPVVCVTGTNGKTTTTRLLAHLAMTAGLRTGWSSTDGVFVQGELIEAGDYSGPSGGRKVLETKGLQLAVLETARGGLLLRGMGVVSNDVAVVTNVSADHLGLQGVDTVDQLAEVKSIITTVTKPSGWAVLNGDDPRALGMRANATGKPFIFSLDPQSPSLREGLDGGGRAITVMDGWITLLLPGRDPDWLVRVLDLPMTMAGLSQYNVANALAATAAALSIGLPRETIIEGLQTFTQDATLNPGRLNTYTLPLEHGETCTVVMDLAHNEAGLQALLGVARGMVAPGGRLLLGLGAVGDRTEEILTGMGELAGKGADVVRIAHRDRYLRGRSHAELEDLLQQGAARVGVHDVPVSASEVDGLAALVAEARPGDVVTVMVHDDRQGVYDWLAAHGASPDGARQIRSKVAAHQGLHPDEDEIAAAATLPTPNRVSALEELLAHRPTDTRLSYELAAAHQAAGTAASDVQSRYRNALAAGLVEPYRSDAQLSLALSLLGVDETEEAVSILEKLREERPGQVAVDAALALALRAAGRPEQAVDLAVGALAGFAESPQRIAQLRELGQRRQPLQ